MSDDMESLPPRLNTVEQEIHTLKHRTTQLEQLPPRVSDMERSIDVIKTNLSYIHDDMSDLKKGVRGVREILEAQQSSAREGVPYGIKLSIAIISLVGAAIGAVVVLG